MSEEMFRKAITCKSPEELLVLAGENGYELTLEQAKAKFAELHAEGEMADYELDNVAGGACNEADDRAKGSVRSIENGDIVRINDPSMLEWGCSGISCTCCGSSFKVTAVRKKQDGVVFGTLECMACGKKHTYRTENPQHGTAFNII